MLGFNRQEDDIHLSGSQTIALPTYNMIAFCAIRYLFVFVFIFCIWLKPSYCQYKKNSTKYPGVEMVYSYRKINEFGGGMNFMYMPDWNKPRNIIYTLSYNTYWLFGDDAKWSNRINIDLSFWKKQRKYFYMPNLGSFLEYQNVDNLNSGVRVGLNCGAFLFLNYQYTVPINKKNIELVSQNSISIALRINWLLADFGYYSKWNSK